MNNNHFIKKATEYLTPALRQHRHNYGSEEFISAFDYEETIRIVANLMYVANKAMQNQSSKD